MGYLKIPNLYQKFDLFECFCLEKIHGCVRKGTLVRLSNGLNKPIEEIKKGEEILSFDTKKRCFTTTLVDCLIIQEKTESLKWVEILLEDGRNLICTEDHPLLTTRGWIEAVNLTVLDDIIVI